MWIVLMEQFVEIETTLCQNIYSNKLFWSDLITKKENFYKIYYRTKSSYVLFLSNADIEIFIDL